jgi:hypothetical protein
MEIHLYSEGQGRELTIHYGPDWWLEEDTKTGYSASYKIIQQFTGKTRKRALCVLRMPRDWIGDSYLGSRTGNSEIRTVLRNIKEVPSQDAVWKMILGEL